MVALVLALASALALWLNVEPFGESRNDWAVSHATWCYMDLFWLRAKSGQCCKVLFEFQCGCGGTDQVPDPRLALERFNERRLEAKDFLFDLVGCNF